MTRRLSCIFCMCDPKRYICAYVSEFFYFSTILFHPQTTLQCRQIKRQASKHRQHLS